MVSRSNMRRFFIGAAVRVTSGRVHSAKLGPGSPDILPAVCILGYLSNGASKVSAGCLMPFGNGQGVRLQRGGTKIPVICRSSGAWCIGSFRFYKHGAPLE